MAGGRSTEGEVYAVDACMYSKQCSIVALLSTQLEDAGKQSK